MDYSPAVSEPAPMPLTKAIGIYVGCLMGLSLVTKLIPSIGLGITLYLACGVLLNRLVLRRLVSWHPVHATIGQVSSAKLWAVLLWPLSYLFLFLRLAAIKVL